MPIVFAERVTEFSSLILIILIGIKFFEINIVIVFVILTMFILGLIIVLSGKINRYVLDKLKKFKIMKRFIDPISISLSNSRNLLEIKPFFINVFY